MHVAIGDFNCASGKMLCVIAFYLIPVFAAWYYLESYFPLKDLEPVGSYIQTLGIDSHC